MRVVLSLRLCGNGRCHREEAKSRRGDPVISSIYTGLLRHFVPRNDIKLNYDTVSLRGRQFSEGCAVIASEAKQSSE